jgi:hypothetical protein
LKKGSHYCEIPSLFDKQVKYSRKEYTHSSPAFRISYPKHCKVVKPELKEVFRAKCSFGGAPIISVSIDDMPKDIQLMNLGEKFYLPELKKSDAKAKITSNIQTKLFDGTQANEVQFDCVAQNNRPLKISIRSTYRSKTLIFVAVQSWAFPDSLKEFLYR